MLPPFLTANEAAALRPEIRPQTQMLAQRYAQALQRLIRLRAIHGDTELRCQLPPELVGLVTDKLNAARFGTVILLHPYSSRPNGRLIVNWPDTPMPTRHGVLSSAGLPREGEDYPELFYRVHRALARWGLVAPDAFQVVRLSNAYDRASNITSRD